MNTTQSPVKRGLACCSPAKRKKVASAGGKAVAMKKGHMAKIGRLGGSHPKGFRAMMI